MNKKYFCLQRQIQKECTNLTGEGDGWPGTGGSTESCCPWAPITLALPHLHCFPSLFVSKFKYKYTNRMTMVRMINNNFNTCCHWACDVFHICHDRIFFCWEILATCSTSRLYKGEQTSIYASQKLWPTYIATTNQESSNSNSIIVYIYTHTGGTWHQGKLLLK